MATIVWSSTVTDHSGYLNLFYLGPEGTVERERCYTDQLTGHFIMGGPALWDDWGSPTPACKTLVSLLAPGFHFYPESSADAIRESVKAMRDEFGNGRRGHEAPYPLVVVSQYLDAAACADLLLQATPTETVVVFADIDENGDDLLCMDLAQVYYKLPKDRRDALGLKRDWGLPDNE